MRTWRIHVQGQPDGEHTIWTTTNHDLPLEIICFAHFQCLLVSFGGFAYGDAQRH
jgi:hypothetical protein